MISNLLVPLVLLSMLYGLCIFACIVLLRIIRVSARWRIVLGFLIFAIATGLLVALQWPQDNIFLYNFPAQFFGYEIYYWSIQLIGDPTSANAHDTIPWFLRIPQVFVAVSMIFWGLLGAFIQLVVNARRAKSC
ncbi:MAG: hypothetical protein HZB51_10745 [Chloroflexi bacterium]|nr:hypothetical protein [Chloroflexota bacterium]